MTTPASNPLTEAEFSEIERLAREAITAAGYIVTQDGRVLSRTGWRGTDERELTQLPNAHGYASVRLTIAGARRHFAVHRLVAVFHLPPRPSPLHEIRHLDGSRTNSAASNLVWGTRAQNAADRKIHGTERAAENGRKGAAQLRRTLAVRRASMEART